MAVIIVVGIVAGLLIAIFYIVMTILIMYYINKKSEKFTLPPSQEQSEREASLLMLRFPKGHVRRDYPQSVAVFRQYRLHPEGTQLNAIAAHRAPSDRVRAGVA